jgi:citrate lyase synthetase
MLLPKNIEPDSIMTFKLVNGDEIVARVTGSTQSGWMISRPCSVLPSQQGIGLMQTLFAAELNTEMELKSQHVILYSSCVKQIEDHYLSVTTGIKTVSKGPIIV